MLTATTWIVEKDIESQCMLRQEQRAPTDEEGIAKTSQRNLFSTMVTNCVVLVMCAGIWIMRISTSRQCT